MKVPFVVVQLQIGLTVPWPPSGMLLFVATAKPPTLIGKRPFQATSVTGLNMVPLHLAKTGADDSKDPNRAKLAASVFTDIYLLHFQGYPLLTGYRRYRLDTEPLQE